MWTVIFTLLIFTGTHHVNGVQVETVYGPVEGTTIELIDDWHSGISVNTFYSIPFAKPPLGDLRFAPPQEPDPWDDVFEADYLGTACEQNPISLVLLTHPFWRDFGEDCLHLHIFTPADMSGAPYPVMVWLYGGGFYSGANIQYSGHFLAAQGVVVVIPNYRLEIMGFAYSGDDVIPGNMGLMDQTLALQFVQQNIEAFGGDPGMVTIFGESAGGRSVGLQMMTPYSENLFHQAILQSGSEMSETNTEQNLYQVALNVNCTVENTAEMAACLREKTPEQLRRGVTRCGDQDACVQRPKVDGDYIPDTPENLRERGEFNIVPEIIGLNRHDGFLILLTLGPDQWVNGVNRSDFQEYIRDSVESNPNIGEDRQEDYYQAMDFYYSPWPHIHDGYKNRHQLGEMNGDKKFAYADWQAKLHQEYAPVFYYVFDYMSPDTWVPEFFGTPHGIEVPYIWGRPFIRHNPEVRNQTEIIDQFPYQEADDEYSYFMMRMWADFAKYGHPTPHPIDPPTGSGPTEWTQFLEGQYDYLYMGSINDTVEMRTDFRQHEYAFWREYLTWMVFGDDVDYEVQLTDLLPFWGIGDITDWKECLQDEDDVCLQNILDDVSMALVDVD